MNPRYLPHAQGWSWAWPGEGTLFLCTLFWQSGLTQHLSLMPKQPWGTRVPMRGLENGKVSGGRDLQSSSPKWKLLAVKMVWITNPPPRLSATAARRTFGGIFSAFKCASFPTPGRPIHGLSAWLPRQWHGVRRRPPRRSRGTRRLSQVTRGTAAPLTPLRYKQRCLGRKGASSNGGTPKAAPPNLHAGASSSDSLHSTDTGRQGLGACQKASPAVWGAPSEVGLN